MFKVDYCLLTSSNELLYLLIYLFAGNFYGISDIKCPIHPLPVDLPKPLPEDITNAFHRVESVLEVLLKSSTDATGVTFNAVYGREVIWKWSFGCKNLSQPEVPPDENTIFRIGSVSKVFPVLMMYDLYGKGLLKSFDDQLDLYATDFYIENPFYPGSRGITFRQVASQLSGLPREAPCVAIDCNVTTERMFQMLENQSLILPPWTVPSYSNLGFALIGHILAERILQTPYEHYVQKNILAPLHMENTGFQYTKDVVEKMAVGYINKQEVPLYDIGWVSPAGQMYSTTKDLSVLIQLFLQSFNSSHQSSIGITGALLKEMLSPIYLNPDGTFLWGTPWEILFQNTYLVRTKGGNIDGYSALLSFVPELQLGISILWNGQASETDTARTVYSILIPAFVKVLSSMQPPPPQPKNSSVYIGKYIVKDSNSLYAIISEYQGLLLLELYQKPSILFLSVFLIDSGRKPNALQIYIPEGTLSCVTSEFLAYNMEFVVFSSVDPVSGHAVSFTLPGIYPGIIFVSSI